MTSRPQFSRPSRLSQFTVDELRRFGSCAKLGAALGLVLCFVVVAVSL